MDTIKLTINSREYKAEKGMTILEVCKENNIYIPTLCHSSILENYGACRLCVVELDNRGRKKLVTSCTHPAWDGLTVNTDSERVLKSRKMTIELLLSRCPQEEKLQELAKFYSVKETRFIDKDENCILCGLCVRMCQGLNTNAISFINRGHEREVNTPYSTESDVCLTCGACASICPMSHFSEEKFGNNSGLTPVPKKSRYEAGLVKESNIAVPFTQAVPNMPVIDRENCIHFHNGGCGICQEVCEAEAIDYEQEDETVDIEAGAVVITGGGDVFDPDLLYKYGYTRYKDVITSLEFERILSASGPFGGEVVRLSDNKHPDKIAFMQCIGSRDESSKHGYCSSVCCMYAIKEAIIAKEHMGNNVEITIYFMDIRCYGKDFEKYYERAQNKYGIRFIRTRAYELEEKNNQLSVNYCSPDGTRQIENQDMVVLSVGFNPSSSSRQAAAKLKLAHNKNGFIKSPLYEPTKTTHEGVFTCGVINGPKDIPETVAEASAVSANINEFLSSARGTLTKTKEFPEELDIFNLVPRIGVFVCHCGINIGSVVDVKKVAEHAKTLPNVIYAEDNQYTCSQDSQERIKELVQEYNLNRVVVASCSPRTHEPLFQETIREAGLNKYLFEMANIRDQCSWVHPNEPEKATEKSIDLLTMAVNKARLLTPLKESEIDVLKSSMIIGGGVSGMNAALNLAAQDFDVVLVEKENSLGGFAKNIKYNSFGDEINPYLEELIKKVENNSKITVFKNCDIQHVDGYIGNYNTKLLDRTNNTVNEVTHGTVIITVGADEYKPKEFLYGKNKNVKTQTEFEDIIHKDEAAVKKLDNIAMIQCVGSRNDEHPYCSRVCCQEAVKNAIKIKEISPDTNVYVFYRDIRTYGLQEENYRKARKLGVVFIRFEKDNEPEASSLDNGNIAVSFREELIGKEMELVVDKLILSAGIVANANNHKLAQHFKLPLNDDGFFLEAHVKLRPVDFATEGVYLAGTCHAPKDMNESISQSLAAAGRALTVITKDKLTTNAVISSIDENLCAGCKACVEVCAYKAIDFDEEKKISKVNEALCKGCGACAASCRSGAADLKGFTNEQIFSAIDSLETLLNE
ncbi:MAG: FAD-dependent oxidoreductase [Victivallales bacterium]|nr:FAD-dependent oxidoreductase [Victivallales bacterium]